MYRGGSDKDVEITVKLFEKHGFKANLFCYTIIMPLTIFYAYLFADMGETLHRPDQKANGGKIKEFATSKFHKNSGGCAAMVIMSHGLAGNLIETDCRGTIEMSKIVAEFGDEELYPLLKEKLKLIVFNACRSV